MCIRDSPYCTLRTVDPDFAGTIGTTCYVAGTLAGTVFTPAETCLTASVPTEDDGLTYMALGTLTGTYQTCVFPEHPLYRFVDGAFKPLSQVAYEASVAVGETRREMSKMCIRDRTTALTPDDITAMVAKYLEAENVDISALSPDQVEAIVTAYAEATGVDTVSYTHLLTWKATSRPSLPAAWATPRRRRSSAAMAPASPTAF